MVLNQNLLAASGAFSMDAFVHPRQVETMTTGWATNLDHLIVALNLTNVHHSLADALQYLILDQRIVDGTVFASTADSATGSH